MKTLYSFIYLILLSVPAKAADWCAQSRDSHYLHTKKVLIETLKIDGLSCQDQKAHLESIKSLTLRRKNINSIDPLLYLKNLEQLDLSYNRISKANRLLTTLKNLKRLNLSHNRVNKISFPNSFYPIVSLNVDFQHQGLRLDHLDNLSNLKRLSAKKIGLKRISDLGPLPASLKTLDVSWNPLHDVDELGHALDSLNINFFATKRLCQNKRMTLYRPIERACQTRARTSSNQGSKK